MGYDKYAKEPYGFYGWTFPSKEKPVSFDGQEADVPQQSFFENGPKVMAENLDEKYRAKPQRPIKAARKNAPQHLPPLNKLVPAIKKRTVLPSTKQTAGSDRNHTYKRMHHKGSGGANAFHEILKQAPGLAPLIDYCQTIPDPKKQERTLLLKKLQQHDQYAINRLYDLYLKSAIKTAYDFSVKYHADLEESISNACFALLQILNNHQFTESPSSLNIITFQIIREMRTLHIKDKSLIDIPQSDREKAETIKDILETYDIPIEKLYSLPRYVEDEITNKLNDETTIAEAKKCLLLMEPIWGDEYITRTEFSELEKVTEYDLVKYYDYQAPFEEPDYFLNRFHKVNHFCRIKDEASANQDKSDAEDAIIMAFERLTPKQRYIVGMRLGIYGEEPRTLAQIGEDYHVSRERIRQIESKILKSIRNRWHRLMKSTLNPNVDDITKLDHNPMIEEYAKGSGRNRKTKKRRK